MATYIEPFDLYTILVGYFLGSEQLFAYAFVVLYSIAAAQMQFSNKIYLSILGIGSIMFSIYLGEAIYFLVLMIMGFLVFKMFSKILT